MTADQKTRQNDDVGSFLGALTHNWWLILTCVAVGIVAGIVLTLLQPKTYDSTSSVYLGQTTDANGNAMAGLTSNAKAAAQLLSSQALLKRAAETTGMGMTPAILRRQTTVETPTQAVKTATSVVNFIIMTVRDESPERAAKAANALADELLAELEPTVEEKIAVLEDQVETQRAALDEARIRARDAQKALAAIAEGGGDKAAQAVAAAPYLAIVQAAATEQEALLANLQKAELMLLSAINVEKPRLLHAAAEPDEPSGPDLGLNVAAGALAGLVVGILAAFVRQRRLDRAA
jgi:uncharacterized protein involved in exopolysaccharide biosynthesis